MSTRVEEATSSNPLSVLGEALESAAETFGDAATNARASAKVAAKSVVSALRSGVYKSAYGISYGFVFSAAFLNELLPENNILRRGFEEGAEAALVAATNRKAVRSSGRSSAPRKRSSTASRK